MMQHTCPQQNQDNTNSNTKMCTFQDSAVYFNPQQIHIRLLFLAFCNIIHCTGVFILVAIGCIWIFPVTCYSKNVAWFLRYANSMAVDVMVHCVVKILTAIALAIKKVDSCAWWAFCQIRKNAGCACTGTQVPWCMPGSLTNGFLWSWWRGNCSRYSGACATHSYTHLVRGPWKRLSSIRVILTWTYIYIYNGALGIPSSWVIMWYIFWRRKHIPRMFDTTVRKMYIRML